MDVLFIILAIVFFLLVSLGFAWVFFPYAKTLFFIIEVLFCAFILVYIFWYLGIVPPKLHLVVTDVFIIVLFLFLGLFVVVLYERTKNEKQRYKLPKWFFWLAGFVFLFSITVFIRDIVVNPGHKPESGDLVRLAIFTSALSLIALVVLFIKLNKKQKGG